MAAISSIRRALAALLLLLVLPIGTPGTADAQTTQFTGGGAAATPLNASTAATLQKAGGVFTPWQFGAAKAACTTNNVAALRQAAAAAVAAGGVLDTSGSCLGIADTFVPPAGLVWRSDFTDANRLYWLGSQSVSPIEVTGAIDIDGIVLDGQRPPADVRTVTSVTKAAIGFGFHGSMVTDAPTYLTGVKVGRIKYMNGEANTGIAFVNVQGLDADQLTVENNWGQATSFAGVKSGRVKSISTNDIGNLGPQTGRAGQSVAIFAEADPGKKPASWYTIAATGSTLATSQPCRNILPLDDLWIGSIKTRGNTDTDVYAHDYGPDDTASPGGRPTTCSGSGTPGGWGTGIGNVRVDAVDADLQGKDLVKVRRWAYGFQVGTLRGRRMGNRAFSAEVWSHDVSVGFIDIDGIGYDVVRDLLGDGQSHLYSNNQTSGTATFNGTNETLATAAYGISIIQNAYRVSVGGGYIRNVSGLPYQPTSQGYCVTSDTATDVTITVSCDTSGGSALRVSNTQRFQFKIASKDACRAQTVGSCYAILATNDGGGENANGRIEWTAWESTGTAQMYAPIRIAGSPSNLTLNGSGNPADFVRGGFSGNMVVVAGGTATNVQSNWQWQYAQSGLSGTTDADGRLVFTITAHSAPVVDGAYTLGATTYRLLPYATTSTSITLQAVDAAGAAAPVGTSITGVTLAAHVQNANGY